MTQFEIKDVNGRCEDHKETIKRIDDVDKKYLEEFNKIKLEINSLKDNKVDKEEFYKLKESLFEIKESNFKVQASLSEVINNISEDRESKKRLYDTLDKVLDQMAKINEQNMKINNDLLDMKRSFNGIVETNDGLKTIIEGIEEWRKSKLDVALADIYKRISFIVNKWRSKNKVFKYIIDGFTAIIGISVIWTVVSFFYYLINKAIPFEIIINYVKEMIL